MTNEMTLPRRRKYDTPDGSISSTRENPAAERGGIRFSEVQLKAVTVA